LETFYLPLWCFGFQCRIFIIGLFIVNITSQYSSSILTQFSFTDSTSLLSSRPRFNESAEDPRQSSTVLDNRKDLTGPARTREDPRESTDRVIDRVHSRDHEFQVGSLQFDLCRTETRQLQVPDTLEATMATTQPTIENGESAGAATGATTVAAPVAAEHAALTPSSSTNSSLLTTWVSYHSLTDSDEPTTPAQSGSEETASSDESTDPTTLWTQYIAANTPPQPAFFPQFASLPTELRAHIWELCLPRRLLPMSLFVECHTHFYRTLIRIYTDGALGKKLHEVMGRTCHIETVCREARAVARSCRIYVSQLDLPWLRDHPTIYFDHRTDTILIDCDVFIKDCEVWEEIRDALDLGRIKRPDGLRAQIALFNDILYDVRRYREIGITIEPSPVLIRQRHWPLVLYYRRLETHAPSELPGIDLLGLFGEQSSQIISLQDPSKVEYLEACGRVGYNVIGARSYNLNKNLKGKLAWNAIQFRQDIKLAVMAIGLCDSDNTDDEKRELAFSEKGPGEPIPKDWVNGTSGPFPAFVLRWAPIPHPRGPMLFHIWC
jgi:hypothetical protein